MVLKRIVNFVFNEDGQGMVEYGLIIAFIALAVIAAMTIFGGFVRDDLFMKLVNEIPTY